MLHQHHFVSITVVDAWNGDLKRKTECVKESFSSLTKLLLFYSHATPEVKYESFECSIIDLDKYV